MSTRKISDQQQQRIRQQHTTRSNRAQRPAPDAIEQDDSLGPELAGLVIAYYGKQAIVEVAQEDALPLALRCHLRTHLEKLVAGDRVVCRRTLTGSSDHAGVIVAVLPRNTLLTRPDNHGVLRPVAANVDTILVVIAPVPEPHANLIDRYCVAAENAGMEAVLVYNKCDHPDADTPALRALRACYAQLGYHTFALSAKSGIGLPALHDFLAQRTCVLVGQSGVGKSSLINALLPEANTVVGELSVSGDKGTHTTTGARLYHIKPTDRQHNGCLIDSPGIREFSLCNVTPQQVLEGFRELREYSGHCKFRDCRHQQEPGCAMHAALANGTISAERFASYEHIVASLTA